MKKTIIRTNRRRPGQPRPPPREHVSDVEEVSSDDESNVPTIRSKKAAAKYAAQRARDALDPFDVFKCFPVTLETKKIEDDTHISKKITFIDRSKDIIFNDVEKLRGVETGACSNLTILDVRFDSKGYSMIENLLDDTLCVRTPNQGWHLYYEYDDRLNTIYDMLEGVSVLNNNCFAFAGSGVYQVRNKFVPVSKMPQAVFDVLYEAQQTRPEVYTRAVEAFAGLSDDWFVEETHFKRLIHVLQNAGATEQLCLNTLKVVLVNRFGWYDRYKIKQMLKLPMTNRESRYKLKHLIDEAKDLIGDAYETRIQHFRELNRKDPYPRLKHEPGAITKLQNIKVVYPDLTARKILAINAAFTSRQINVCKQCGNQHGKQCCEHSTPGDRSKHTIIDNITIIG